jgi:hypothetical protein
MMVALSLLFIGSGVGENGVLRGGIALLRTY